MTPAFAVIGFHLHTPPLWGETQDAIATLTVEYGAVVLAGVQLVRMKTGELRISIPRIGRGTRAVIRGHEAHGQILALACAAYRTLSGRDPAEMPLATASKTEG